MENEIIHNILYAIEKELDTNDTLNDLQIYNTLKYYMYSDISIMEYVKRHFGKILLDKYDFEAMDKAFNLSNDLPFYKKQEIYKSLPFSINDEYYLPVINTIFPCEGKQPSYDNVIMLAREYLNRSKYDYLFDNMKNFFDTYNCLRKSTKKKYDSYLEEYYRYKRLENATTLPYDDVEDFDIFLTQTRREPLGANPTLSDYCNNSRGKYGEYIVYELLTGRHNLEFVSRDLGDGFGYDLYYQELTDDRYIEHLVEVKSTSRDDDEEGFLITDNEYNTMNSVYGHNDIKYDVYRLFIFPRKLFIYLLNYDKTLDLLSDDEQMTYVRTKNRSKHYYMNVNGVGEE